MPLYDYRCPVCSITIELYQHHHHDPAPICTTCIGPRMIRQLAAPIIRTSEAPTIRSHYSKEGFRITTTDCRKPKDRIE
jgi:putative FmdB family regulatory protein